jgi:hypothetical protein
MQVMMESELAFRNITQKTKGTKRVIILGPTMARLI